MELTVACQKLSLSLTWTSGEERDHLLTGEVPVMVEVVFAEQVVEELQTCRGKFHWRAGAGNHRGHQLLPGQAEIVTVAEPDQQSVSQSVSQQALSLILTSSV